MTMKHHTIINQMKYRMDILYNKYLASCKDDVP